MVISVVRTISSSLLTAQNAASNTPYIYMVFTSADGGTTYDYSSDQQGRRILSIDHFEEPYGSNATVILRNEDRSIPNMVGYWTEIGYGYVTGSGNEYSQTARLWVKHQQIVSAQGKLVTLLELEGMWERLSEILMRVGSPPYYQDEEGEYTNITPYDAMAAVLVEAGMTLDALVEDDGIIDTYLIPVLAINMEPFESAQGLIYRLLNMTKCYLRPKVSLAFEVKYPQSGDSVDIIYYSYQAPYFYDYSERYGVIIPNHIIVFANEPGWSIDAEASDQDSIDAYGDIIQLVLAGEIANQSDADDRASAILARIKMESMAGRMYSPHDCRLELYDRISIEDTRGV